MRLIFIFVFTFSFVFITCQNISAQTKFAVIGDYGYESATEATVSDMIDTWNADFVITLGDNNYDNGSAATIDQNIGKDYNQWIYPYFGDHPPNGNPDQINKFFPSLGNHDYFTDNAQPYIDYFTLPNNERWYTFSWDNIDFFVLDSEGGSDSEILAEQVTWLYNAISNSTETWKVVYFHHPPYSSRGSYSRMRLDYISLGVDLVLSGHDHLYERLEIDGLTYIVNGLGGKSIYSTNPPIAGSTIQYNDDFGAQLITANETEMTLEFWSIGSNFNNVPQLIDTFTIYPSTPPPSLPPVVNNGAGFALDFDGSNDYVLVPDDNSLDITSTITLEAWLNPDDIGTQYLIKKAIYGSAPSNNNGYELSLSKASSGTKFFFRFNQQESDNLYRLNSTTQYQTGIWTHIAATYDGTTMRMYINGVEDNSLFTSPTVSINSNTLALALGAQSNGGRSLIGQLDEVRVWNIARTELQIREYMCKKLTGTETGLVGYWRFDETQGLSSNDETINFNHGTMTNMFESDHIWSGATLGDDITYDYDPAGGYTDNLSHSDGDNVTVTTTSGTIIGLQIYREDDNSVRPGSTVPDNYTVDELRYWGVQVIGTDNPTYDIVYNYDGHPGIISETDLKLVKRNDISDPDWVDAGALLDVNAKTLALTSQSGTEYALATISDPLPVELSLFNAKVIGDDVQLYWQTETEVNNYGFDIERTSDYTAWITIGFVEGRGNSNSPKYYNFSDTDIEQSGQYYYRLKQIDNDGTFEYSNVVKVNVGVPDVFYLNQNYPNPFNPLTIINYQVSEFSFVTIKVYDVLGKEVSTLINQEQPAGSFEIEFDGSDLTSGIYFYRMIAGDFIETKSMMLIK